MKSVSTTLKNHIRTSNDVTVVPRLIAEWNLNRYYRVVADNTPAEDDAGNDIELFPIEEIVKANRPPAGIAKAMVGEARVSPNYEDGQPARRWYVCSPDDAYKYWSSPQACGADTNFPLHTDGFTVVRPRIEYFNEKAQSTDPDVPLGVATNKIQIGFEDSFAAPDDWDIEYKNAAGSWIKIGSNYSINSEGRVNLWYNGTNWTTTNNITSSTTLYGLRLVVRSMNVANTYFNLIELGARLEKDLSADLIGTNDRFDLGEPDFITPMGTLSANTASLSLFNDHGNYSPDNPLSPYYGIIDRHVQMKLFYDYTLPNSTVESVQQFKMFTDVWDEDTEQATVSVTLGDFSKFMQEVKPKPVMYQNISVQEAVWRVCDVIGFNEYVVETLPADPNTVIDVFWTTGNETVWEVFQELSRGTQCAIYFDNYGKLNIKSRAAAFNGADASVWTARQNASGSEVEDIINVAVGSAYEANKVIVNYTPTAFSEEKNGFAPMEIVWEPDDTLTLRASDLIKDVTSTSTQIWVSPTDGKAWPFSGMMNIEGEFIRYEGKEFIYYDGATKVTTTVKTLAEQEKLSAKADDAHAHLNRMTGALVIKERGVWNTEVKDHIVSISPTWTMANVRRKSGAYSSTSPSNAIKHDTKESTLTIDTPKGFDGNDYSMLYRGNTTDAGYSYLGTRLRLNKGRTTDAAGLVFNMDEMGGGYFIEVTPTVNISGKERKSMNELRFYSQKNNGDKKYFGGERHKSKDKSKDHKKGGTMGPASGEKVAVVETVDVEIDIAFVIKGNGDHEISIDFNGSPSFVATVPQGSGWQHSRIARSGIFARGHTSATFEYFYAIQNAGVETVDAIPYLDRIHKGFYGQQWLRDWVYETKLVRRKVKKKWKKVLVKYQQRFFEEFGPMIHEVREMDVKYDVEKPVLQSRLFLTNSTQGVCPEFSSDAFGAKFLLCNTWRSNAVMNGDDNLSTPGNTINQKLVIFGRPVITKEAGKITKTDDWAVRRRGEIEVEFSNQWIQSEEQANRLGDWIVSQWSRGASELTVTLFGNPLFELTDVVSVQFDDILESKKFFVTSIDNNFENGITTTLGLRRA